MSDSVQLLSTSAQASFYRKIMKADTPVVFICILYAYSSLVNDKI